MGKVKPVQPQTFGYDQMIEWLGLPAGTSVNRDGDVIASMFMPNVGYGDPAWYYAAEIVNKGDHVDVEVGGHKLGTLDQRSLPDAVDVLRRGGGQRARAVVKGSSERNQTQTVYGAVG